MTNPTLARRFSLLLLAPLMLVGAASVEAQVNIQVTNGPPSMPFFYIMSLSNEVVPVVNVEIKDNVNYPSWMNMTPQGASWFFSDAQVLTSPASLRITGANGQVLISNDVVTDVGPFATFDFGQNFTPLHWADLGQGLAGAAGVPTLTGNGPLTAGSSNAVTLDQALPGSTTNLVIGLGLLDAPFKGGVLVPDTDILVLGLPVDGSGSLAIPFVWPNGVPAGVNVYLQHWVSDPAGPLGFAASNGLRAEAQ